MPSFLPPSMAEMEAPRAPNPAHANPSPALQKAQAVVQRLRERDLEFGGAPEPPAASPMPSGGSHREHPGGSGGYGAERGGAGGEEFYQRTRASMFDQSQV